MSSKISSTSLHRKIEASQMLGKQQKANEKVATLTHEYLSVNGHKFPLTWPISNMATGTIKGFKFYTWRTRGPNGFIIVDVNFDDINELWHFSQ